MKLKGKFKQFLDDEVNLNATRLSTLDARTTAVETFLKNSTYTPNIRRFSTQGSYAHKTIIKPVSSKKEFDADMVMFVDEHKAWGACDYIEELFEVFCESGTYKDKVSRKSRCVTLNYSGDFHLDVVPITVREPLLFGVNTYRVCNRPNNEFELSDGDGFKKWWLSQDRITTNHRLTKVARLMKYLRDTKSTFSCKSILLTTLIGEQVEDQLLFSPYSDVPSTLLSVISCLDDYLQANVTMPEIVNPALSDESFTRNWTEDQYTNFRYVIHRYRGWIEEAYHEESRNESIRKWRRVFGDAFAKDVVLEEASNSAVAKALLAENNSQDPISMLRLYGAKILAKFPHSLPHMNVHELPESTIQSVRVVAKRKDQQVGCESGTFSSGSILPPNISIEFQAVTQTGTPFPKKDYRVEWLVTNTGDHAQNLGGLRGEYERSQTHGFRAESTQYHGIHFVEAVVINLRKNRIVGRSDRFFVVVDNG